MPEAEGGSPTPPGVQAEEKEPKQQLFLGEGGVIRELTEDPVSHPLLQRRARLLDQTPESMRTADFLKRQFEGVLDQATKEEIPENEAIGFLASLRKLFNLEGQELSTLESYLILEVANLFHLRGGRLGWKVKDRLGNN